MGIKVIAYTSLTLAKNRVDSRPMQNKKMIAAFKCKVPNDQLS